MSQVICGIAVYGTFSVFLINYSLAVSFSILSAVVVVLGLPASCLFYVLAPEKSVAVMGADDRESSQLQNWMYREGFRRALLQKDFLILLVLASVSFAAFYLIGLYVPIYVVATLQMAESNYEAMIYVPVSMTLSLFIAGVAFIPLVGALGRKRVFNVGACFMIAGAILLYVTQPSFSGLVYFAAAVLSFGKATLFISSLSLQAIYAGCQTLVAIIAAVVYFFADILIGLTVFLICWYVEFNGDSVRWVTCGIPVIAGIIILTITAIFELPQGGLMLMRIRMERMLAGQELSSSSDHNGQPVAI
jgi:hypothetical protein